MKYERKELALSQVVQILWTFLYRTSRITSLHYQEKQFNCMYVQNLDMVCK
jgi:hypothetical protein